MHIISYVSEAVLAPENLKQEIEAIVAAARTKNSELGITGVLFFENQHFFQTIEGEEQHLRDLYQAIEKDARHKEIKVLIDRPIEKRAFPDWDMDAFFVDSPELISPRNLEMLQQLYVNNFGSDTHGLISFIKKMIDEMDTFKILQNSNAV